MADETHNITTGTTDQPKAIRITDDISNIQIQQKTTDGMKAFHAETNTGIVYNNKTSKVSGTTLDDVFDAVMAIGSADNSIIFKTTDTGGLDLKVGNVLPSGGANGDILVSNGSSSEWKKPSTITVGNASKVDNKTITTTAPTSSSDDDTIPTSKAIYTAINNAIVGGAEYLGSITGDTVSAVATNAGGKNPNSPGDWIRYTGTKVLENFNGTTLHPGDTLIYNGGQTKTAATSWDVLHNEIDTWRGVKVNGTSIGSNDLNLKSGNNITISASNGDVTISHNAQPTTGSAITATAGTGRTYVTEVDIDSYGHVSGIKTATETVVDTNYYVNAASFTQDNTNNNVKMTLSRNDTANAVTANIPTASSTNFGVMKVGGDLSASNGVVNLATQSNVTADAVYCAVKVNSKGIVTAGAHVLKVYNKNETIGNELVTNGIALVKLS